MSLSIQCVDDVVEAHEITDQRQILAIACLTRLCKCAGHDVAKSGDVAHVNCTHSAINGKSPDQASVCLLLWSHNAHKVLIEKGCDDERMMRKTSFLHDPVDLGFAGKVGNVELA